MAECKETEWVQQFHPPGQTRDCVHFRLARSCEFCRLEKELFYSQLENAELCAFINREMKMTGSDPRIAAIVKHIADAATPPPTEEFRPTRGYEQVVSLEDYQKLQRELADANKEADKEHAKAVELCDKLIDLRQREKKLVDALEEISKRFPGNQKPGNIAREALTQAKP